MKLYDVSVLAVWIAMCAISLTQQVSEAVGTTVVVDYPEDKITKESK